MKYVFSRSRPAQTDDPNRWFQGRGSKSFPSGEVLVVTTAITPLVLEFGSERPAVWVLEVLPLYDAVARVKVQAHWQSDVLASFVIAPMATSKSPTCGHPNSSRQNGQIIGVLRF